ncbi:hypothetical protein R1sor_023214 [Riccia sorocarpa]|uniref:Integrase catalytic domain-containing protein n=1 Tax=Riccia sorocarpa TaxID=122646 RepID=A0ABD3GMT5_9MARC
MLSRAREELYEGEWLDLGRYLGSLTRQEGWSDAEFKRIRKKAYGYMLEDGYLWKRPKQLGGVPQRIVCDRETHVMLMKEFHESLWAGHRGIWATFSKLKARYWWKNMYKDVVAFMRYLVLAMEDLSNQVEGRALRRNTTEDVCRFLLEDVVCRYGWVGKITANGGELDAQEARDFFQRYGLKLSLTTAYNPEGNAKSERGHPPIVKALVKACNGRMREWPRLLPFALWADHNLTREELLELRIRQLEQRDEDVRIALERLKEARLSNKDRFDKHHRLHPKAVEEGDWVLVYDSNLDNQHNALKKFAKRWFGPYVVEKVYDNATYKLRELDGARLRRPIAGKRVKIFKKRNEDMDVIDTVEDGRPFEDEDIDDGDELM